MSPKLFAIYVDDLSHELTLGKSGCYIDDQCMNHVMYADDICLMAPSAIGLQKMLDVCFDFSLRNVHLEQLDTKLCQFFVMNLSQKGVHFHNVY